MSLFTQEIKKTWTIKVQGTSDAKNRYDAIVSKLKEIDPRSKFELEAQLEAQVEQLISKAEKELNTLEKARAMTV